MNQHKHTKGIWKFDGYTGISADRPGEDDVCIAIIEDDGGYEATIEERKANASLIAAAPELLEACQKLVNACDKGNPMMLIALISEACEASRAAIAKATSNPS